MIYLDNRGFGGSTGEKETWYLDQWADDLGVFCNTLGIVSPVVLGQFFGGIVAIHYAVHHPTEVSKLILSSTAAQFRLDETVKMMSQLGGDKAAEIARQFFSNPSQEAYDTYGDVCLPLYSKPNAAAAGTFRERAIGSSSAFLSFKLTGNFFY